MSVAVSVVIVVVEVDESPYLITIDVVRRDMNNVPYVIKLYLGKTKRFPPHFISNRTTMTSLPAAATIRAADLRIASSVRLKTSNTSPKLAKARYNKTTPTCILPRRMTGLTPAWKRHLIRENRAEIMGTKSSILLANLSSRQQIVSENVNFHIVMEQIKSFSIGSLAGLLGSLAGMGGGFVMIPLMTAAARRTATSFWKGGLGLSQHQAHGTSLFAVGTTGLAGALGYGIQMGSEEKDTINETDSTVERKGLVELDTALALTTTAMITARLGAISSAYLSERVLKKCLGAFMICIAPLVPGKAYLEALHDNFDPSSLNSRKHLKEEEAFHVQHDHLSQIERLLPASLIGIFSGFLSGMFGVGGGAIVVPALVLTTDMSHHAALGTSLCAMVLPAMIGTYTHATRGNVNWRFGPLLALGSATGAFIGGREVGIHLEEDVLRGGFACLMLVLGLRTWRK